jgi:hypothetical protein
MKSEVEKKGRRTQGGGGWRMNRTTKPGVEEINENEKGRRLEGMMRVCKQ